MVLLLRVFGGGAMKLNQEIIRVELDFFTPTPSAPPKATDSEPSVDDH